MAFQHDSPFPPLPLPSGITESYIPTADLTYHILTAGSSTTQEGKKTPLILLFHGFPEVAYSWRKVMPPLAAAGYYVVAYDQRGFGRTTGWDNRPYSEVDLSTFRFTTLVIDALRLVFALGFDKVTCVVGHDFGAVGASMCALTRPDVFKSLILMSHPVKPPPNLPFDIFHSNSSSSSLQNKKTTNKEEDVNTTLAALPIPRKPYKKYYSTPPANDEMTHPKSEIHTFLRGYFHLKSADWAGNSPHRLTSWTADQLSLMPHYYVMPLSATMREAVSQNMALEDSTLVAQKSSRWLPDHELAVYAEEWARNSFQGGLNWYRVGFEPDIGKDLSLWTGKKIEVPTLYIAGRQDWGTYQVPGSVEAMQEKGEGGSCADFRGVRFVDGAGHWVQQEQPEEVVKLVLEFLREVVV